MQTIIDLPLALNRQTKPYIYLISTFSVVNILFFIDEGYYDLRWMANPGNWIAFALYFVVLFFAQFGMDRLLSALKISAKVSLSIVLGCIGGLIFLILGVFRVMA